MTRVIDLSLVVLLFLSFSMLRSCPTGWFRLGDTSICLIFVRSLSNSFSWDEADRICRERNANLFNVNESNQIGQVETIYRTIRTNSSSLIFEQSVWIEKTSKRNRASSKSKIKKENFCSKIKFQRASFVIRVERKKSIFKVTVRF